MTEDHPDLAIIKSKRKRNRKKKKKTKKPANDDVSVGSNDSSLVEQPHDVENRQPTTIVGMLVSPQEKVRSKLMEEGYSATEIDQAMETMWDKGLAYDEYSAVLKFVQSHAFIDDEDDEGGNAAGEAKYPSDQGTVQTASTEAGEAESMSNSASINDGDDDADSSGTPKSFRKTTLAEKLDMVSKADSVTDAIFALTQWVNKAANPQELDELCLAQKTRALPVVFHRGMEECMDQTMFDTAVLPGLLRLVLSIFSRRGISLVGDHGDLVEASVESLLKQTRKVFMIKPSNERDSANEVVEKVSQFIVSQMAEAIAEAKWSSSSSAYKVSSMTSKHHDDQVCALISKVEFQKHSVKRAAVVLRSSLDKLLSTDMTSLEAKNLIGFPENPYLKLVDNDTKTRFEARKMRLEQLKAQVRDHESDKINDLRLDIESLESERLAVQEKIAELRMALQRCEEQDQDLAIKIGSLKGDIAEQQSAEAIEAMKLQEQILEAKEAVKYGNLVGSLSGMMKACANHMELAANKSLQVAEKSVSASALVSCKMESYLKQVLEYFQSESQCVRQLKSRLESNTSKVSSLKIELEQLAGLGLTATANQIEGLVASREELIEKDSKMLVAFTNDSASMFDELISRLDAYSAATERASDLKHIHYDLLIDIKSALDDCGIAGGKRLSFFIPEARTNSPIVMTKFTDTTASSVATPSPQQSGKTLKKVEAVAVLPKLSWATFEMKAQLKGAKMSFLDIQKEELGAKE